MTHAPTFRMGQSADSADLALLFDAASRRICAWLWGTLAAPGQSCFEVGRQRISRRLRFPQSRVVAR